MSDNLVKRLRETTHMYQVDCELKMKCADRIEQLVATNEELEAQVNWYRDRVVWGFYEEETPKFYQGKVGEHEICEPVNAEQVTRYFKALDIYEAKLEKVVEALGILADDTNWFDAIEEDGTFSPAWRGTGSPDEIARTTIAELTGGGKDEDEI